MYAAKFKADEPNVIITGGWDNTVQIWDMRTGVSVRSIYGPHICGDALDIDCTGKQILTGSWRPNDALQLWDYGSGEIIKSLDWSKSIPNVRDRPAMIYSASFKPGDSSLIAAGGCGTNEVKIFDASTHKAIDRVLVGDKGVYTLGFSPNGRSLAIGGGDPVIHTVDLTA